jgi:hypothetical protein
MRIILYQLNKTTCFSSNLERNRRMSDKPEKKSAPKLEAVVDLTYMNASKRMDLVGEKRWLHRRIFLKNLLGSSALIAMPGVFAACEEEECSCQSDVGSEGCASQNDTTCACQSDSVDSVDSETECSDTPPTVQFISFNGNENITDIELGKYGTDISILFSTKMQYQTGDNDMKLFPYVTIDPEPLTSWMVKYSESATGARAYFVQDEDGMTIRLAANTTYTITISGEAQDLCGNQLDGNGDGVGGDDFVHTFNTDGGIDTCTCQSDSCACESNTCSCQSYSCACESFDCSCQFEGCPLYGIY